MVVGGKDRMITVLRMGISHPHVVLSSPTLSIMRFSPRRARGDHGHPNHHVVVVIPAHCDHTCPSTPHSDLNPGASSFSKFSDPTTQAPSYGLWLGEKAEKTTSEKWHGNKASDQKACGWGVVLFRVAQTKLERLNIIRKFP